MLRKLLGRLRRPTFAGAATCPVCGGSEFGQTDVLWDELISQWKLSSMEAAYVNRQQGYHCRACGANLRSMALAGAILEHFGHQGLLREFCERNISARRLSLLEINTAGSLTPFLSRFRHHRLVKYPEVDIQALPYPDDSWDIVVHSDVLEHVPDPEAALMECRRVLKPNGLLAFTIPVIYGRLTRRRGGDEPVSYHGTEANRREDCRVFTEYGADFWLPVMRAGFRQVGLYCVSGPEAIAITCRKGY